MSHRNRPSVGKIRTLFFQKDTSFVKPFFLLHSDKVTKARPIHPLRIVLCNLSLACIHTVNRKLIVLSVKFIRTKLKQFLLCTLFLQASMLWATYRITPLPDWVPEPRPGFLEDLARIAPQHELLTAQIIHFGKEMETNIVVFHQLPNFNKLTSLNFGQFREYFKLEIHRAYRLRNGKVHNILGSAPITFNSFRKYVRGEEYDQKNGAKIHLPKAQNGDFWVFAFSLRGSQPDSKGRIAYRGYFRQDEPAAIEAYRLIFPKQSSHFLHTINGFPAFQKAETESDSIYTVFQTASKSKQDPNKSANKQFQRLPFQASKDQPIRGYTPRPEFYVSDFASWEELAAFNQKFYTFPDSSRTLITETAQRVVGNRQDRMDKAKALIRFVKEDITYEDYGLLQPRTPATVLRQRRGDCKSKVWLLKCLLESQNIESWPVLVRIDGFLPFLRQFPSTIAFNHIILEIDDQGRSHFVDATTRFSTPLNDSPGNFNYGLRLHPESSDLLDLPKPAGASIQVFDYLNRPDDSSRTTLQRRIKFGAYHAAYNRLSLKSGGPEEVFHKWKMVNNGSLLLQVPGTWNLISPAEIEVTRPDAEIQYYNRYSLHQNFLYEKLPKNEFKLPLPGKSPFFELPLPLKLEPYTAVPLTHPHEYVHYFCLPGARLENGQERDTLNFCEYNISFCRMAQQKGDTLHILMQLKTLEDYFINYKRGYHRITGPPIDYLDLLEEWDEKYATMRIVWSDPQAN